MSEESDKPVEIWHLRDWFAATDHIQRDLITKLDYPPNTAYRLWHGLQQARSDHINQIAAFLNIEPFELLMAPEKAMSLRRMRRTVAEAAGVEPPVAELELKRTGTEG